MKYFRLLAFFFFLLWLSAPLQSGTSEALLMRGTGKALGAAMSIPAGMMAGAARGGFPFGMIGGILQGTFSAVGNVVSGAFDLARGAAPYAKYAILAA